MNKKFSFRARLVFGVLVFLVILTIVGLLMGSQLTRLTEDYIKRGVSVYAKSLAEQTNTRLNKELESMSDIAEYISGSGEDPTKIISIVSLGEMDGVSYSLMSLDGKALYGKELRFSSYPAIQNAFRGNPSASSYEHNLLFTAPVYNGKNIKYVLCKLYDESAVEMRFGIDCYNGNGMAIICNNDSTVFVPYASGEWDKSYQMVNAEEYKAARDILVDKLNTSTSAATNMTADGEEEYVFLAEVNIYDLYITGKVPAAYVSDGISGIVALVLWVFAMLIVLMLVGLVYLFSTEEKVKESDALREAKTAAERANRAKTDFLTNISHEIRTPINALIGMNEMIMRETDNDTISDYSQGIRHASYTLLNLVNDILDFSKIEAGKMEIVEHQYELGVMISDLMNMIQQKSDAKGLLFSAHVDSSLPELLYGDDSRIKQIAINLLTNAVKYTEKGSVVLSVEKVSETDGNVYVKISVKDTGIGIKEEEIPMLCKVFQRLELEKNRTIEGTGLGLAIVKSLTEQMGGTMNIESVYGEGSLFSVVIPQRRESENELGDFVKRYRETPHKVKKYKESFTAPDANILAVDDNRMNLVVLKSLLKQSMVRIDTCMSGASALEAAAKKKYDLIFLDHMMPEMDGIETLNKLRADENSLSRNVTVVALTANAVAGMKEMYLEKGFDDYLSKPIESALLEKMMIEHLPKEKVHIVMEGNNDEE